MMKKIILVMALIVGVMTADAQRSFEKGDILLNPGVGLGSNYIGGGFHPSFFFSADFGVHDYVSVGPYVGTTFFNGATGLDFGARGNFHFWQLIADKVSADLKEDQLELYFTLWLGGEIVKVKNFGSNGDFDIGSTLGLRWYPNANNRFALYGEFGYTPISWSVIGCTIKL